MSGKGELERRVVERLEQALDAIDRGEDVDLEALCADAPEVAGIVAKALEHRLQLRAWGEGEPPPGGFRGTVLADRYVLIEQIGAGAMGAVYRAMDSSLKREVAIKLLQPYLFGGRAAEERFDREAESLAALEHPNVVRVYDRGASDGHHRFLVMELLRGAPLSEILTELERELERSGWDRAREIGWLREAFPEISCTETSTIRQAARWVADLAAGLSAVHAAGVFHRDVKPSNVFIEQSGRATLIDFGIAARQGDATVATGTSVVGTPKYMSPEQETGRARDLARVDVYSLTATFYHALTGRPPRNHDDPTTSSGRRRLRPPAPDRLHRGLPVDLVAILEHGMRATPAYRYPSTEALRRDLEAFLAHAPVSVRRRGPVRRCWDWLSQSRTAQVSVLLVLVAVSAWQIPGYLRQREQQLDEDHLSALSSLPPAQGFGRVRRVAGDGARRAIAARLDRAVAARPDHAASRVMRAAFAWDHGHRDDAAADIRALAAAQSSPYTTELAARYAAVAATEEALDLSALPKPRTAADRYVAGYHAMRQFDYGGALRLLDPGDRFAAALRLLVRLQYSRDEDGTGAVWQELYDDARDYENRVGRTTSIGRFVAGTTQLKLGNARGAVGLLREAYEISPESWQISNNLAQIALQAGRLLLAERHLEAARRIRPESPKTLQAYANLRTLQGRFEEADAIAKGLAGSGSWRGHAALLTNEAAWASHLTRSRTEADDAAAVEHARRGIESGEAAIEHCDGGPHVVDLLRTNIAVCQGVVSGDPDALVEALLTQLARDPFTPGYLDGLYLMFPQRPKPTTVRALRLFLRGLEYQVRIRMSDPDADEPDPVIAPPPKK